MGERTLISPAESPVLTSPTENLAPGRFVFWQPPVGAAVSVGPARHTVPLPACPLPILQSDMTGESPSDAAIGQGAYDYLRQFPDCVGNLVYAELLRDAYPHFIADLASQAVMIDAKQVDPAFVVRKLTCLKILRLLDPNNCGLLQQLCRGYFELALEFSELARCRRHLHETMRFGQELLKQDPTDLQALSLLAEVDQFFGDMPAALGKWRQLADLVDDPSSKEKIAAKIASCSGDACLDTALVDDLEILADAMHLHAIGDNHQAVLLLEKLEEQGRLMSLLPFADFYWLMGVCRKSCGDTGGAFVALQKALELEPDHAATQAALATL